MAPTQAMVEAGQVEPKESQGQLPQLENGDHLSRAEFERRYEAMPDLKKAELVEGVVYVGSPVSDSHGRPHSLIMGWLNVYWEGTPGVDLLDNNSVRLDLDNVYQPDALLRLESEAGGASRIGAERYVEGPPELIVEIAASSASIDRHTKMRVYQRSGVQEYLIWQVQNRRVEWFGLREGVYVPLAPDAQGLMHSQVFPGLCLSPSALLDLDRSVFATQRAALGTPEHQTFVARLGTQRG